MNEQKISIKNNIAVWFPRGIVWRPYLLGTKLQYYDLRHSI